MLRRGLIMLHNHSIEIEYDRDSGEYYIIWQPVVIGSGTSLHELLKDLRETAHFGIDTFVDMKLASISP